MMFQMFGKDFIKFQTLILQNIMQSRSPKYRKSFDNYQQAIQKQLNEDFKVYQYLNQNQLQGNNIDEYLKLYDALQVTKNLKKKQFQSLQVNYAQMSSEIVDRNYQALQVQNWDETKGDYQKRYEQTLTKTSNEVQVKNNLWKEIIQTKKSLNLLKGDMGHLVSRNESQNLLQSKISKVKVVTNNQLKRVSLALVKDKDQLKVRGQMQRKFNKKLKTVSELQKASANRLKKTYLNTMVRKKQMHDRLNYIQKVSSLINQSGDKQMLKNQKNKDSLQLYHNFVQLVNLIAQVPQVQRKYGSTAEQQTDIQFRIHQFVYWLRGNENTNTQQSTISRSPVRTHDANANQHINSEDVGIITLQKMEQFQTIIMRQHARIKQEIQKKTSYYDLKMKSNEEMAAKLQLCNEQIENIENNFLGQIATKYIVRKEMRQKYTQKLNKLIEFLKTIFVLLQYIQKNLNYTGLAAKLKKKGTCDSQISFASQDSTMKLRPHSDSLALKVPNQSKTVIASDKSLAWTNKNYITELHKTYSILLREDESNQKLDSIQTNIFCDLEYDIENWLSLIKAHFIKGALNNLSVPDRKQLKQTKNGKSQRQTKISESRISQIKIPKTCEQVEQEQMNQVSQQNRLNILNYQKHQTVHRQDNITRYHSYSSSSKTLNQRISNKNKKNSVNGNTQKAPLSSSKIINSGKLKNSSSQHKKAIRIKFLEDVDKDYYKMLKSTIKMQKQNTRKNYQFINTFKRAKFSSRDQILQQKRFQCSFSMLFASKKDQIMSGEQSLKSKKSCFFRKQNFPKKTQKLNQSQKLQSPQMIIKTSDSTTVFNQKAMKQVKDSIKTKQKARKSQSRQLNKRDLSIRIKDIINLI